MSGSAVADSAGLGAVEIKAMKEDGYDAEFSAAITAACHCGANHPTKHSLVIYGAMTNTSVGALFWGILPRNHDGARNDGSCVLSCDQKRLQKASKTYTARVLAYFPPSITHVCNPALIMGGIMGGIVTPTESAVLAVLYAVVLGVIIYREMTFRDLLNSMVKVARTVGSVAVAACAAFIFGWVLTYAGLPQDVASFLTAISANKYVFLLIVNILLNHRLFHGYHRCPRCRDPCIASCCACLRDQHCPFWSFGDIELDDRSAYTAGWPMCIHSLGSC